MSSPKEIAEVLSQVSGRSLGSVNAIGQALRGAGLVSKDGRGRSHLHLDTHSVMNWIIGTFSAETNSEAPVAVSQFRGAHKSGGYLAGPPERISQYTFIRQPNAGLALWAALEDCKAGIIEKDDQFEVRIHRGSPELEFHLTSSDPDPATDSMLTHRTLIIFRNDGESSVDVGQRNAEPENRADLVYVLYPQSLIALSALLPDDE